ncbi:uncharacterized protein [Prorops nasuta]|uniref:uncharacterized protein n=1 Tax=Prorops nasuta TaxID=863751 RepID=UPI0034CD657F
MSETVTVNPSEIICGLKAAVTALECHHNMEMMKQLERPKPPSMYLMVPVKEQYPRSTGSKKIETKQKYETQSPGASKETKKRKIHDIKSIERDIKFPELRAGVLYTRCNCVYRDGLQDACRLSNCKNDRPKCLTQPWPKCKISKYLSYKYPDQFPMS